MFGVNAWASPRLDARIWVQVDRKANALRMWKLGSQRKKLDMRTAPILAASLRPGIYHPTKVYRRYRAADGNASLENLVEFDHTRSIRSSRMFDQLRENNQSTAGAVIVEPELGTILAQTIHQYGVGNTVIEVVN